ncbi:hypothetical protein [Litorimonas sp.]|uniref:hypothetical protein n=1 Tax=Litorimonas sp. TaxID=1892381 RepID=UPI003A89572C
MGEFTKGPWVAVGDHEYIQDSWGEVICRLSFTVDDYGTSCSFENAEANAQRIVTAVNCHDELVEACRGVASLLEGAREAYKSVQIDYSSSADIRATESERDATFSDYLAENITAEMVFACEAALAKATPKDSEPRMGGVA